MTISNPQGKLLLKVSFSTDLQCALEQLGVFVESISQKRSLSPRDQFQWHLILEELITNTINYGFLGKSDGVIEVEFFVAEDGGCHVCYRDNGPPFDSSAKQVPEELAKTEAIGFGGMGLGLVSQMADNFKYQRENGFNNISIIKNRGT